MDDDAGRVTYQVGDQAGQNVEIFVNATGDQPSLWSRLIGIATLGNSDQQYQRLGWKSWPDIDELSGPAWIPFVLAGDTSSFVGNIPPADCMHQSLPYLGCQTLQDLVLPGSHDSGMSMINNRKSVLAGPNTQTQDLNVYEQLVAGIRFFDIRPVWYEGEWWTGHYVRGAIFEGANGESLDAVIGDITDFVTDHHELIILNVDNFLNRSIKEWNSNLSEDYFVEVMDILADIPNLYVAEEGTMLTSLTLDTFISTGPAVLIIMNYLPGTDLLQRAGRHRQGFYYANELLVSGEYANTMDPDTMERDQYRKFQEWSLNPPSGSLFQFSWQMTLGSSFLDPTEGHADVANLQLAEAAGSMPPAASIINWYSNTRIPNIVSIDYVREVKQLAALCLAMNRWYNRCAVSTSDSTSNNTTSGATLESTSDAIPSDSAWGDWQSWGRWEPN